MPIQNIGNDVIDAYLKGLSLGQQQKQHAIDSEQRKVEEENRRKQVEAQLAQQAEQFKVKNQLDQSAHELNQFLTKYNLGKDITESGNLPPGAEVTKPQFSATTTPPQNEGELPVTQAPIARDLSGIPEGMMKVTHPVLGDLGVLQTHEANVAQKASDLEKTQGPLEARKIRETVAAQIAETQRQLAVKRVELAAEDERARLKRESDERMNTETVQGRISAAKARGSTDKSIQQAIGLTGRFQSNKLVSDFNVIKSQREFAESIGSKGSDDTGLVYAFIKSQDPNRVTDSEFDLAQKYGQSVAEQFKFSLSRLTSHDARFLSDEARQNMIATINARYKVHEAAFKNFKEETGKSFKMIKEDPDNWLPDFSKTSETSAAKKGDKRVAKNGDKQVFDGVGWELDTSK